MNKAADAANADEFFDSFDACTEKTVKTTLKHFNISIDQLDQLYEFQNKSCAICKREKELKELCLDHCHKSRLLRGLLCRTCNSGLGHFHEDVDKLRNAVSYIVSDFPAQKLFPGIEHSGRNSYRPSYKKELKEEYAKGRVKNPNMVNSHLKKPKKEPRLQKYFGFELTYARPDKLSPWRVRHKKLGISRYFETREDAEDARNYYIEYYGFKNASKVPEKPPP